MSNHTAYLAYELRDGLLQDLVAVSLLIRAAREARTPRDADALLAQATATVEADLSLLRSVIDRLRPAA